MSDHFSDAWLTLREPADRRARADGLLQCAVSGTASDRAGTLEVLDLGCGTGANLRHTVPLLAANGYREQRWSCVDHDPRLLHRLVLRTRAWGAAAGYGVQGDGSGLSISGPGWRCVGRMLQTDLSAAPMQGSAASETAAAAAGPSVALHLPEGGLVTASALLDLVSIDWLRRLLGQCRAARCRLLFTLTYDGRCRLSPPHADDELVIDLVNRHQCTDKGFGTALGPAAARTAARECSALGYAIGQARSDWRIGPNEPQLQQALLDGWLRAALEMAPDLGPRLRGWRAQRLRRLEAGRSDMVVGHRDLWASPSRIPASISTIER
jgi:SAM-dependent methyltransferase